MYMNKLVIFVIVLVSSNTLGLEYNKQRYTQNTDFLLHEAGGNPTVPKRDYIAPQSNYGNQQVSNPTTKRPDFPPLAPPPSKSTIAPTQFTQSTRATQSSGKRDYVASNFPPLNSPANSQHVSAHTQSTSRPMSPHLPQPTPTSGKRDYVNPNFPPINAPSHTEQGNGKVKDLINFYDGKNKQPMPPQQGPSYSSILQGQTNNNQGSTSQPLTQNVAGNKTPKPFSFSAVVSGNNRPSGTPSHTTSTPPTAGAFTTPNKPTNNQQTPSSRPVVLPSSIVNNNKNVNQDGYRNSPTDTELQTISEELLRKDTNNAAKYVTINYQGKTTSQSNEDKAQLPLLTVSPEAWNIPTIQKFLPLLDNYERDTLVNEYVTPQERNEENAFMDAIMTTSVIRHLMNFFKDKGYVTPDPRQQRDFLKQLWFGLYSRGKGKLSSSGFEHSFVSELKNGEVSGLHNWIYFSKEEQANRVNYLGYLKYLDLNNKGAVIKLHFTQQGANKPVGTLFIGTSPELELALYTLCFVTRVDNDCNLKLSGKDVNIVTYKFRYRSKNLVGSAFPQF